MTTPRARGSGPKSRQKARKPGLKATLHARLFGRVTVAVNGTTKRVTVLEAIILQLLQKTATGDARARRLLLRYREFVDRAAKPRHEVVFVDSADAPVLSAPRGGIGGAGV